MNGPIFLLWRCSSQFTCFGDSTKMIFALLYDILFQHLPWQRDNYHSGKKNYCALIHEPMYMPNEQYTLWKSSSWLGLKLNSKLDATYTCRERKRERETNRNSSVASPNIHFSCIMHPKGKATNSIKKENIGMHRISSYMHACNKINQ